MRTQESESAGLVVLEKFGRAGGGGCYFSKDGSRGGRFRQSSLEPP